MQLRGFLFCSEGRWDRVLIQLQRHWGLVLRNTDFLVFCRQNKGCQLGERNWKNLESLEEGKMFEFCGN
jgi:hypothetical protein